MSFLKNELFFGFRKNLQKVYNIKRHFIICLLINFLAVKLLTYPYTGSYNNSHKRAASKPTAAYNYRHRWIEDKGRSSTADTQRDRSSTENFPYPDRFRFPIPTGPTFRSSVESRQRKRWSPWPCCYFPPSFFSLEFLKFLWTACKLNELCESLLLLRTGWIHLLTSRYHLITGRNKLIFGLRYSEMIKKEKKN